MYFDDLTSYNQEALMTDIGFYYAWLLDVATSKSTENSSQNIVEYQPHLKVCFSVKISIYQIVMDVCV